MSASAVPGIRSKAAGGASRGLSLDTLVRAVSTWTYVAVIVGTWVMSPFLRRFTDWLTSYHTVSIFAVTPLLVLMPAFVLAKPFWQNAAAPLKQIIRIWLIAFGYSFLIAFLSGSLFAAAYDLAQFCFAIALIFVLDALKTRNIEKDYARFATICFWFGTITSVYAIYQFVSPPPWDIFWADHANIASMGHVEPFGFRVFGTLNIDGILATFLGLTIVINLPRLRARSFVKLTALGAMLLALALTSVRSVWITLAGCVLLYIFVSPRRWLAASSFAALIAAILLIGSPIVAVIGSNAQIAVTSTIDRALTFGDLGNDSSAIIRAGESQTALSQALEQPLGYGLGSLGLGAKLTSSSIQTIDNGLASRLFEMGFPGLALFLTAIGYGIVQSLSGYAYYRKQGSKDAQTWAATAFVAQTYLLAGEIFADQHIGISGLFFWSALFFGTKYRVGETVEKKSLLGT